MKKKLNLLNAVKKKRKQGKKNVPFSRFIFPSWDQNEYSQNS